MLLWLQWHSQERLSGGHISLCHRAFAQECKPTTSQAPGDVGNQPGQLTLENGGWGGVGAWKG